MYNYKDFDDFTQHRPYGCPLVSVEIADNSHSLPFFSHPERAIYLLGAEDNGLPKDILNRSQAIIQIPAPKPFCLNVAVAGSIVMYDRFTKTGNQ